MKLNRSALLLSLLLPLTAQGAINLDPTDPGGGTGGTGGGGTTSTTWLKSYTKSGLWGDSDWGAGYKIYGNVSAVPAHDTVKDTLGAKLGLETYANINGSYTSLFAVRATGSTEAKARTDLSFAAYVGSAAVYTKTYASTTSTYTFLSVPIFDWSKTFFNKSVNVTVGFIPVTFTVKSTGQLKGNLTGKISNVGIEASANPGGKASLYASAAIGGQYCVDYVGCVGASAGVYADVTLVEASAPGNVAIWWSLAGQAPLATGVNLNYVAKASATLSSLNGELGVFADACLIACVHESAKLIDWSGFTATYSIANMSGSYCLTGDCSSSMGMAL